MSKDQSIPRRNKVDWHIANDDPILTTIRFIPKHETIQKYGAILPDTLTNQAIKEEKTDQGPKASLGKRLKSTAKVAKSRKKKLHAKGLETLSKVALSEAEHMKIAIKRSKTQFHSSQANGSEVPDVPTYGSDDEQISWKSSDNEDDDDQDDNNEQTESDNDDDDFVHSKLSTFDEEERYEEKLDKEKEDSDQRFHIPSHFVSTDDEAYDEVTQGDNVEKEKQDEEKTNKEEEVNELYNDMNINLEGRDTEMIDALLANSSSVSSGFISKMLNPNLDTGIDSILNLNTESTFLVDVPVTTNDEIPPLSVTTFTLHYIPFIHHVQQTFISTPTIAPNRLKDEAQAQNEDFINKLDENMKKVIIEQVKVQVKEQVSKILPRIEKLVNEQLEAEVLSRSSNEARTSHAVAANLSNLS
nr:hypothetical protein [Tanacetum cinerariifolium]